MFAITGANGHLGQRLLKALEGQGPVRALVRSERAAAQLRDLRLPREFQVGIVDYRDADALGRALDGCAAVVHLAGIIKEKAGNSYRDAHESTCQALAESSARTGVERIVYLSILGAAADAANPCLASKGAAERILGRGRVPTTIIRVPMVLGEGDYASAALARRARRSFSVLFRAGSFEQPIYAADVVAAVQAALADPHRSNRGSDGAALVYDLAGPESLSRAALTHRAARVLGRRTRVVSLPLSLGLGAALVVEKLTADPLVTRAMLGVLDHDDRIDPQPAVALLGLRLTPLDDTLRLCMMSSFS